ncbi:hypothetical protein AC1031_002194 [Aphanomyces cochlioides]|nr:hypothetical protein AC1031_002194 [Aphanomyces cochlioides]
MSVDDWDIEADLQFLFAHDDQLHEDDACSVILASSGKGYELANTTATACTETDSNDESAERPQPKRKARSQFEARQKDELKRLRDEVQALKSKLDSQKAASQESGDASYWKRTANVERMEKVKTVKENETLRDAVAEQATFIEYMQKVLSKKPRFGNMDMRSEEWKAYKLAAQYSLRVAAIQDRQYTKMDHAFLRAGVLHQTEDLFRAQLIPQSNGTTVYELVNHMTVTAPFQMIGASIWKSLEVIDSCTVYSRIFAKDDSATPWQSNLIRKYYPQTDRCAFIGRTVLEDAIHPPKPTDVVEDKWIWIQVVPVDIRRCRITALVQVNLGHIFPTEDGGASANELSELMNGLVITQEPPQPVSFPRLPTIMGQETPAPSMPHIAKISEGARRVQALFSRTINDAIVAAQACSDSLDK